MARALVGFGLGCVVLAVGARAGAVPNYDEDAKPIYQKYCTPCHAGDGKGDHNIAKNYADGLLDSYYCQGKKKAECTVERIKEGSMPEGGGKVAPADLAVLVAWIAGGLQESPEAGPDSPPDGPTDAGSQDPGGSGEGSPEDTLPDGAVTEGAVAEETATPVPDGTADAIPIGTPEKAYTPAPTKDGCSGAGPGSRAPWALVLLALLAMAPVRALSRARRE
jgi:hypothetical protein